VVGQDAQELRVPGRLLDGPRGREEARDPARAVAPVDAVRAEVELLDGCDLDPVRRLEVRRQLLGASAAQAARRPDL
jgi:hypothetical protein